MVEGEINYDITQDIKVLWNLIIRNMQFLLDVKYWKQNKVRHYVIPEIRLDLYGSIGQRIKYLDEQDEEFRMQNYICT